MKTNIILILLFSISCGNLVAQDFKIAMTALQEEYKSMNSMQVEMEVKVFDKIQSKRPVYTMNVEIKKSAEKYLYRFGQNEMLMNEKYLVTIDRASKSIIYSKRDVKAEIDLRKNFRFNLDSILSLYDDAQYLGEVDGIDHYRVSEQKGEIKLTDIFIRRETNLLKRMTYEYKVGQYVSIDFNVFDKNPVILAELFDENQFIVKQKNKMVPATNFKGYHIDTP